MSNIEILKTFQFDNNQIRIVEKGGEPWFVAADVCRVLEIRNPTKSLYYLNTEEKTLTFGKGLGTQTGKMNIISESGLYKLILRSNKPQAKPFQDWVTQIILPTIRKDGGYIKGEEHFDINKMSEEEIMARAVLLGDKKIKRLQSQLAQANARIEEHLDFLTVDEWRSLSHKYLLHGERVRLGQRTSKLCRAQNIPIGKQSRLIQNKEGEKTEVIINVYPKEILDEAASQLGLAV